MNSLNSRNLYAINKGQPTAVSTGGPSPSSDNILDIAKLSILHIISSSHSYFQYTKHSAKHLKKSQLVTEQLHLETGTKLRVSPVIYCALPGKFYFPVDPFG